MADNIAKRAWKNYPNTCRMAATAAMSYGLAVAAFSGPALLGRPEAVGAIHQAFSAVCTDLRAYLPRKPEGMVENTTAVIGQGLSCAVSTASFTAAKLWAPRQ